MGLRWTALAVAALAVGACAAGGTPPELGEDPVTEVDAGATTTMTTTLPSTSVPAADDCGGGREISGGGTYSGSTCDCGDGQALSCNPGGHAEATFQFTVPPGAWGCKVVVGGGLAYQFSGEGVATGCGGETLPPDPSVPAEDAPGILFGGGAPGHVYGLTIERYGESCGDYTFTVVCGAQSDLI